MKILILGYGNPGRGDDALGPVLADAVEAKQWQGVSVDTDYQLNIEYALDLPKYDIVIFADASVSCQEPFEFRKIEPSHECACTTHSVSPESLLALTVDLNERPPDAYVLAVRGYDFEFKEGLSDAAKGNLKAAIDFLDLFVREHREDRT